MRKLFTITFSLVLLTSVSAVVSAAEPAKEPVVIVPGFLASWNWGEFVGEGLPDEWRLTPLEGENTYGNLIQSFLDQGYQMGQDLFLGLYDWRQSNLQSYSEYLMPIIDKAVANSPTGKVDIVAHSMGGLLARSYIQSDNYRDDVDQLIMVATPNNGSSDVYLLWSGGKFPTGSGLEMKIAGNLFLWQQGVKNPGLYLSRKDIVQNVIPAARELLPGYDFLVDDDTGKVIPLADMEAKNPLLPILNHFDVNDPYRPGDFTELFDRVRKVSVFSGDDKLTLGQIYVDTSHVSLLGKWSDGKPIKNKLVPNVTDGDGTVLVDSSYLPYVDETFILPPLTDNRSFWQKVKEFIITPAYAGYIYEIFYGEEVDSPEWFQGKIDDSGHRSILTTAIPEIHTQLGLPAPNNTYVYTPAPADAMAIFVASPVIPVITAADGRILSRSKNDFGDQATYIDAGDPLGPKVLIIPNPAEGEYSLQLTGVDDGDFHIGVYHNSLEENLGDLDGEISIPTIVGSTVVGKVTSFAINFSSEEELTIVEEVIGETSLQDKLRLLIEQIDQYQQSGGISNDHTVRILRRFPQSMIGQLDYADSAYEKYGDDLPAKIERRLLLLHRGVYSQLWAMRRYISLARKNNSISLEAEGDLIDRLNDLMLEVKKLFTR